MPFPVAALAQRAPSLAAAPLPQATGGAFLNKDGYRLACPYTVPCCSMASATFLKPAMFAPATKLSSQPASLAAPAMLL